MRTRVVEIALAEDRGGRGAQAKCSLKKLRCRILNSLFNGSRISGGA